MTGTREPLVVALRVDSPPTPVIGDVPSGPRIQCSFGLTAVATGYGSAQWEDGKTFWFAGVNRATPIDSTSDSAGEIQAAFGASEIKAGETEHAQWTLTGGAPFEATLTFRYAVGNATPATASAHISCGPSGQGSVAPVITQLSTTPAAGELSVGDTISVSYQETGATGVWETVIDVTGPFTAEKLVGEHLAASVNRTVTFVVPPKSRLAVPITIVLHAMDAALQESQKSLVTQLSLVDHVPPTMVAARLPQAGQLPTLVGQYAVGDTITLTGIAEDNNALGWLVYALGAPANARDSMPASTEATYQWWDFPIVVRPEWVGTPVMTVYARDAGGLTSQSLTSMPDSLRFYPRVDLPTTSPLRISAYDRPTGVAYDAKRDLVYAGISGNNQVAVFNASTMALQPPIALPAPPDGLDLSVSGDSLLVALPSQNAVAIVDLKNPTAPATTLHLTVLDTLSPALTGWTFQPHGVHVLANGKLFVVLTHMTTAGDQIVEVDLATGSQRMRTDARQLTARGEWLGESGRAGDRSRIYLVGSCTSRYETATDAFAPCAAGYITWDMPISVDAAGANLVLGSIVLDSDLNLVWGIIDVTQPPPVTAISSDGTTVYIGVINGLTAARISDHIRLERVPLPLTPQRLLTAPNGKWLLAFNWSDISHPGAFVTRVDLP